MATRPLPNRPAFTRTLVVLSTVVIGTTAAACGSSPSAGRAAVPAATLLLQAESALARVPVVKIEGSIVQKDGSATDSVSVDAISGTTTGTSEGTLDLEGPGLGFMGATRYVVVGSSTWVTGTTAFWKSYFGAQTPIVTRLEAKVFPELVGHWIELLQESTEMMYKDALGLSEPRVFVTGTLAGVKGTLTNSGTQTVNGERGVELRASTGSKIIVAGTGAPLPIELADTASTSGSFSLDLAVTYPAGVKIAAPADFASLETILTSNAG